MSEFLFECRQRSTYPLCFQEGLIPKCVMPQLLYVVVM